MPEVAGVDQGWRVDEVGQGERKNIFKSQLDLDRCHYPLLQTSPLPKQQVLSPEWIVSKYHWNMLFLNSQVNSLCRGPWVIVGLALAYSLPTTGTGNDLGGDWKTQHMVSYQTMEAKSAN